MKKLVACWCCVIVSVIAHAQSDSSQWHLNTDLNLYFIPQDFFILPVVKADKNNLHLEARYNYEDRETFSGWIGYNFAGGNNKFEYQVTPMLGGVVGLSDGIAPGLEATLALGKFELYSEGEFFVDFGSSEGNYFYNWTDLTYSPTDWLWLGISGQRTRVYKTALDIQRGFVIGASWNQFELSTYVYNPVSQEYFFLVTLSAGF